MCSCCAGGVTFPDVAAVLTELRGSAHPCARALIASASPRGAGISDLEVELRSIHNPHCFRYF
jgi:hypothetical protein